MAARTGAAVVHVVSLGLDLVWFAPRMVTVPGAGDRRVLRGYWRPSSATGLLATVESYGATGDRRVVRSYGARRERGGNFGMWPAAFERMGSREIAG